MSESYFPVYGWMPEKLGIGGAELLTYALIYSFTNAKGQYTGSLQYLADRTGISRRTVIRSLQKLTEQGLLLKKETFVNGVKTCEYRAASVDPAAQLPCPGDGSTSSPVTECPCPGDKLTTPPVTDRPCPGDRLTTPPVTECPCPGDKLAPNTKEYTKDNTKEDNEREAPAPAVIRHRYGEYENVLLSDGEIAALRREYPDDWRQRVDRLSEYMASTGKSYRNHLATIRSWARQDAPKEKKKNPYADLQGGLRL